jgi:poly-beta-1,6-N-acetyl-D-glucosamine N-deacetylase
MAFIKRLAWYGLKAFSVLVKSSAQRATVAVFTLHRVLPDAKGEMEVAPEQARAWIRQIASEYQIISGLEFVARSENGFSNAGTRIALITVDDAYVDAYEYLFPILNDLEIPVVLFVPTHFIDSGKPPISFKADPANYRPCTWDQLREMAASPWVTLGCHSHRHIEAPLQTRSELIADTEAALGRFQAEGLLQPKLYAYPRGQFSHDSAEVLAGFFRFGFAGAPHHSLEGNLSRMAVPRVPLRGSDAGFWGKRKIRQGTSHEEYWVERIKSVLAS